MNDNDIIKAWDILDKFEFFGGQRAGRELWLNKPYDVQNQDIGEFLRDVDFLKAFIKLQKSEIDRLQKENSEGFAKWQILDKRTKERYAELYEEAKGVVRTEAIKEFAEKIKGKLDISVCGYSSEEVISDIVDTIDNIVKELTENQT